jgi:ATP/maltotriose-dependent transcriptional regulator MalT
MGAPRALALCRCFGGQLEFQSGRYDDARTALDEAVALYREIGSASGESFSLQRLGVLQTVVGELDAGQAVMSGAIGVAERAAMRSHCLTRLHASLARNRLAAGDLEGAEQSLREGLDTARRHGHCVTCNALLLPEAVRVELALGNVDAADLHAADFEETAASFDSEAWRAMSAHARARVMLARDDKQNAADKFEQARLSFLAVDQPYEAARCLVGKAAAMADDAAVLADARTIFESLGAAGVED